MSATEKTLDYNWKEGFPGSLGLLLLLLLMPFLPAIFKVFVDSVAQKGTNLAHEGTATSSPCKTNTVRSLGAQAPGLGIQMSGKH